MTDETVALKNVTFKYDDKTIIRQLNLTVVPGQRIALLGRSGSGKTTLLKLITGDILPVSGQVTIGGQRFTTTALSISSGIRPTSLFI